MPSVPTAWPMGCMEDYARCEAYSQQPPATPRGWRHQIPSAHECPDAPLRKPLAHPRKASTDLAQGALHPRTRRPWRRSLKSPGGWILGWEGSHWAPRRPETTTPPSIWRRWASSKGPTSRGGLL